MNERTMQLPGGERLTVRPMQATDADAVLAGITALSPESFRRRFFSPVPRLLPGMAEALTAVDDRHLTLLAFDEAGQVVAMAEAIRDRGDPRSAEFAVAVADAYQHRGIGTRLLRWLSHHAAEEGVDAPHRLHPDRQPPRPVDVRQGRCPPVGGGARRVRLRDPAGGRSGPAPLVELGRAS